MQLPRASLPRAPTMGPEDAAPQSPPWTGTAPIGRRSPPRRPNTPLLLLLLLLRCKKQKAGSSWALGLAEGGRAALATAKDGARTIPFRWVPLSRG
jgi:hypothetical protein